MFVRSEMCAACHDVTNALPIKNALGKWVGGFPIERTYTEWATSRYADRPGNANYDPGHKRDCQSCHMQQDYGQPGTAQTLYDEREMPLPVLEGPVATDGRPRPFFTHHFVGGNALVPRLIGKDVDRSGNVAPYPELSAFSFTSADHDSPYSRAVWTHVDRKGAHAQQARMAWDRLRHVLSMDLRGPEAAKPGAAAPISIRLANTGSGHNFPTGFPEGRIAWVAVHAYDLATGRELLIHDSAWQRSSYGVGGLTTEEVADPSFPGCNWMLPAASVDPYAVQFKAVASLGDGCPTLDLPYATPLNLVTDERGLPVDALGRVIDARLNPNGLPQFRDLDGDGDFFDDSYLRDTRLAPMPLAGSALRARPLRRSGPAGDARPGRGERGRLLPVARGHRRRQVPGQPDRHRRRPDPGVVRPGRTVRRPAPAGRASRRRGLSAGPDGRAQPDHPDPGRGPGSRPRLAWPSIRRPTSPRAHQDAVVKVFFSEPVTGVDAASFTLTDARGRAVPARVDPIGDGAWGLFPDSILLAPAARYTAHLAPGICDAAGNCTREPTAWTFTTATDPDSGEGDTGVPPGFRGAAR